MSNTETQTTTQEQVAPTFEAIDMTQHQQVVPATSAKPALTSGGRVAAIVPTDIEQVFRLAKAIAAARWAPRSYMVDPKRQDLGYDESKIVLGVMHGMELGLTPIASLQSIAVINNVPSIWGDGALAIIQASGLLEDFKEVPLEKDGQVIGYRCSARRKGIPTPFVQQFLLDDAAKAGLLNKDGPWQQYRARMLQMRARAWTLRAGFADVLRGLAIAEEAQDIIEVQAKQPAPAKKPAKAALDAFAGTDGLPPTSEVTSHGGNIEGEAIDHSASTSVHA
jgi:hypothetical protein